MNPHAPRRERLIPTLRQEGLNAFLISNSLNVTYLTGFTGDSTHLLLAEDRTLLVSDSRYTEQLAEECPGLETYIRPVTETLTQAVAHAIDTLGCRSVGFESGYLTVHDYESIRAGAASVSWK